MEQWYIKGVAFLPVLVYQKASLGSDDQIIFTTRTRAAETVSDLFTTFHANISDGERFLQCLPGQFLCFTPISYVSPQKSSNIHAIYQQHAERHAKREQLTTTRFQFHISSWLLLLFCLCPSPPKPTSPVPKLTQLPATLPGSSRPSARHRLPMGSGLSPSARCKNDAHSL